MKGFILPTKILVKAVEKKDKVTQAGIILSASIKNPDPCTMGSVVLVGEGTPQVPMCVREGQTVLYPPRAFQPVRIEEEDYSLIDLRDVLYYY